jgi:predicted ATPase/DNA-binding winged helix-turn-helix (wHTH) protein
MGENDRTTLEAIVAIRKVTRAHTAHHGGRLVDATGDALLAEFASAVESVRCAVAIQRELTHRNLSVAENQRMVLRIGLSLGDVIERESALYGDDVNIAARLQALGEPGGVCVSGSIHDNVEGKLPLEFRFAGELTIKNIAKPVRAYHLSMAGDSTALDHGIFRFDHLEIDPTQRLLRIGGQSVGVAARSFDLLLALIERRHRLVSKDELLDIVWPGVAVETGKVQAQIAALRKVLGPQTIVSVPGLGYRFIAGLEGQAESAAGFAASAPQPQAGLAGADAAARMTNVPAAADELIGRDVDVAELGQQLIDHRLVTVVGAGGIGKTRVAQEVARQLEGRYRHGVWWVDLSALSSADKVAVAVANATNLQLGDGDPVARLVRALAQRSTLLVLDNCEHLAPEVADIAGQMLAAAPNVRVLTTSQEVLRVPGEQVFRLDALAVPPGAIPLDAARTYSAVRLLEQRAQAVDRHFALTETNVASAIELCRHLDGIALAIEMAAARLPFLGLDGLGTPLGERLRLLRSGGGRGVPLRQQTLRATLDWSHSLLTPVEQTALARLSVFAGSFRLEMAQRVVMAGQVNEWDALDALTALVEKSLVQTLGGEPVRYRLLETMRMYAAERLAEIGETEATRQRHAAASAALAEAIELDFWRTADTPWLDRYAPDYSDLQAAFEHACRCEDAEAAAPIANALLRLDQLRNVNAAVRGRAEAALTLARLPVAGVRAGAILWGCVAPHGLIALTSAPRLQASREAALAWRAVGNPQHLYLALGFLASECSRAGDGEAAGHLLAEMFATELPSWPPRLRMRGAAHAGSVYANQGDSAGYRRCGRAELALAEQAGAHRAAAWARLKLADAALMAGDVDEAVRLGREAVSELGTLDQPSNLGLASSNLCAALLMAGDAPAAYAMAKQALPLMSQNEWAYLVLDPIALLAAQGGHGAQAAQLLGYVDAWYASHRDPRQLNEARLAQMTVRALEAAESTADLARWRAAGAQLTDDQACALARQALGDIGPTAARGGPA